LQGKIVNGGNLQNGNEEEGEEEETLTEGEMISRIQRSSVASPEKHLLRGFSFRPLKITAI